jgi:chromosome segregation ATPase
MSTKIRELRRKLEKLEKEAEELRRLKSDCNYTRKFRRMLVKEEVD